ncbi:MAG: menaquinone biosynthesis protein [Acidobacteria bacterium]|nr:menaquinone biosynthesis protein [Acidobacteriota bacterium]
MIRLPLRVAAVSYLNSVPLYWGLIHGPHRSRFQVTFELPSRCADALRAGEVDAGIIPSIEYQRIPNLTIVPGLAVASSGPVRSVLLISKCPVERIKSLALTTASRTSVCLIQILLQRYYHIAPQLVPHEPNLQAMLAECDAALLIGDPALASDFPGLKVYDLADEWRAMTGLPFVFALWAVRAEAATSDLVHAFQQSTVYALAHLSEIVEQETARTGLSPVLIRAYLTENIDFSLGEKNLEGLRLFYTLAHDLGLTDQAKPLEFIA